MKQLSIKNLHAETIDGTKILKGISLTINPGEHHVIMGPNGGGKSTLAQVCMGHPGYKVTEGSIMLDGVEITSLPPHKRSQMGLFLGFQYPVEIPGVNFARFLRQSVNNNLPKGDKRMSPVAFRRELKNQSKILGFSKDLAERSLNQGFSGGEKKKAEVLQLALLKPAYAILDEPDSGLDIDALQSIADGINKLDYSFGMLLITHYQRILFYIRTDFVHVIKDGKIVLSGGPEIASDIEKSGYEVL